MANQLKNQHLMWRAGFGPAAAQLKQLKEISPTELYKALQKASAKKPDYLDVADSYLKGFFIGIEEVGRQQRRAELNGEERKMLQKKQRESIRSLNLAWLTEMVNSKTQLREKMSLFWHGHFASRNINVFYQQDLLQLIRSNALESFRDLLHLVSKSAAILNFLNAAQNRKDHPNENFAREVMELFTLGRGNYTEADIKEAARAFTGWGANLKGEFVFHRFQHDNGTKTIFNKTGNFGGEDVLDMLLEKKATAYFITQKIYRYFVNENTDREKVEWLATRFFQSDYNISGLMEDIFTSDWFYEARNIGNHIKSPVELIAGIQRLLPMDLENEEGLIVLQRILGQVLFYPPNVAGWPGGKSWIDSSTLMMRLRIPQLINDQDEWNIRPKNDDDQTMGRTNPEEAEMIPSQKSLGKVAKLFHAKIDWSTYIQNFDDTSHENLLAMLAGSLLQTKTKSGLDAVNQSADNSSRESFIRSATIQLMSMPEYQLC